MQNPGIHPAETVRPCPQCGTAVKIREDPSSGHKSCPHCGYVYPNQIANFKLIEIIGSGGMGTVYRGLDISLERDVAVKVMQDDFAKNPDFVKDFLREARAAASLNHPNIGQIYSFGEQNSCYYLVMELLPHGSLDDRIEKEKQLQELEALDIGIQVASGLRAAYKHGLIHRDIKPGNILFARDGTAKVVDFGLARFEKRDLTGKQEDLWGTPYYIAPEKVAGENEDFRSDIYSLGGTLFHALTGNPPFEASTSTEVVLKRLSASAVSLQTFVPDCTPQTAEIIGRMLKRNPMERPQNYDKLIEDLAYAKRSILEKKEAASMEASKKTQKKGKGLFVGILAVIVIGLAGAVWFGIKYFEPGSSSVSENPEAAPVVTATATQSQNHSIPPSPDAAPPPAQTIQPLSPNDITRIERAHQEAGRANFTKAINEFEQISRSLPDNHPMQAWLQLHAARAKWMAGHEADALMILQKIVPASSTQNISSSSEAQYPSILALILLGKISSEALDKTVAQLPDWMQAIAKFDAGLTAIDRDQLPEAKRFWKTYTQIQTLSNNPWVLEYQQIARDFCGEYDQFLKLEKDIKDFQTSNKPLEVQQLLKENQGRWKTTAIRNQIAELIEINNQALLKLQKEQEEKARSEQAQLLESEKKLIDGMEARVSSLMKTYQFNALLEGWKALFPRIKTDDKRKILDFRIAVAQCLVDYKQGLIKDIQSFPYDQEHLVTWNNQKLNGKLYQVKDESLFFRIDFGSDQFGETTCRWVDLPPSGLLELGDFYLMRIAGLAEPNNSEIAKRAIALAVFAREFDLRESYIRKYLSMAMQTGANVKDKMDRLFPSTAPRR